MSNPTKGDIHVNRPLTNLSVAYTQEQGQFVADKVFPVVPVQKQSDLYYKYTKADWMRIEAQERARGTESAGGSYKLETDNYNCKVDAIHKDIDDQDRANEDEALDMDRDATNYVSEQLLLRREKRFMDAYMKLAVWTGSTTGADIVPGTKWDASGSDPVNDVDAEIENISTFTGRRPNRLIVSSDVHVALKSNASILDRIKHTQRGVVTEELLAMLFGVEKYLVARASHNSAAEGVAATYTRLAGSELALLTYAAPAPSKYMPSGGYIFGWKGLFGSAGNGQRIKSFRMESLSSDRIEGELAQDMKLVAPDLGALFKTVLT